MNLEMALRPLSREQAKTFTKTELIELLMGEQEVRRQYEERAKVAEEECFQLGDRFLRLKTRAFTPRTEKSKPEKAVENKSSVSKGRKRAKRNLKPSERYPKAEIIDQDVEIIPPPSCNDCGSEMNDSGMNEVRESLTVIPKQYLIKRQHFHKYSCKNCHDHIVTAPSPPRIKPGSSYDDELIVDVATSKFCDLVPIERYCSIANMHGFSGLPPHSLIELTHYLADYLKPVYELIKKEVQGSKVLHADETPHRMLEGAPKKNWFLWGFSNQVASYFECHDTRSGDVAIDFLSEAQCEYLVSDVYSGYNKAIRLSNKKRKEEKLPEIKSAFCNAHARRKLREIEGEDGNYFVSCYQEIYKLEKDVKSTSDGDKKRKIRERMRPHFEYIKKRAEDILEEYSTKSQPYQAANYFLNNYEGLTRFLSDPEIPPDNNHMERGLRNSVIGRKTWFGTHSKRGALTAQILFSIMESCKINKVNPRQYLKEVVRALHQKLSPFSPHQAAEKYKTC